MKRMDTYALPVNLTSRHLRSSAKPADVVDRTVARATHPSDEALRMDLVIRRHEDDRFSARARLPLPGRDVYATAVDADLPTAIVKLIERLVRRSRGRKNRAGNTTAPRRVRKTGVRRALSVESSPRGALMSRAESIPVHHETTGEWTKTGEMTLGGPVHAPSHILLAIDYSKSSEAATRAGAALAAKIGARLTLLHVLEPVTHEPEIVAHWIDFSEQRRHYELARLQLLAKEHASIRQASCSVKEGRPWEEIVRFSKAKKVDLIVMGRSGSRWFGRLTARTVERVAQNSHCPVLIIGQDQQHAPFEPRHLLVPTDFSPGSIAAFPWAERIARRYGAKMLLANVQDPMALPGTSTYAYFHREIDEQRKAADTKLESWRQTHLAPDLPVDTRVTEGLPAPALCRLLEKGQADLVVMSTHGAKGWVRKWLGGTTEAVLRNVTCSVLVVPPHDTTPSGK